MTRKSKQKDSTKKGETNRRYSEKPARYQKSNRKKTSIAIAIGASLMILGHLGFWEIEKAIKQSRQSEEAKKASQQIVNQFQTDLESILNSSKTQEHSLKRLMPAKSDIQTERPEQEAKHKLNLSDVLYPWAKKKKIEQQTIETPEKTALKKQSLIKRQIKKNRPQISSFKDNGLKKIVIIIDDMGVNRKLSEETVDISAPLTLAFLPYAEGLKSITEDALYKGHELMIHMPMEPIKDGLDLGHISIRNTMSPEEIDKSLDDAFKSFNGYVGINNHMGSLVTQNQDIMNQVMNKLAERNLLFVDSKTISTSVAGDTAARHGLSYAERDVFLDHHETDAFVKESLEKLEAVAKRKGYAIAIGHPKRATIDGLKNWIPTLKEKGFEIVPISAVVQKDPSTKFTEVQAEPSAPLLTSP